MRFCQFIAMLLLFQATALHAADGPLSLREAIGLALKQNGLLKAAGYGKQASGEGVAASRSRFLPRVFLEENFSASNAPTRVFMMKLDQGRFTQTDFLLDNLNHPASANDFRTAFTLELPVFDPGLFHGLELAVREDERQDLELERRREEVAFKVFSTCLELQKARSLQAAAESAVRDATEHLRLARVRNDAGTGLRSDVLRAGTYLADMEQQRITAGNNVLLAGMRLAVDAGGRPGEVLEFAGPVRDLPLGRGAEELAALAQARRKDLKALENDVARSRVEVNKAGSAFLPTLYAGASYQMNDRNVPFGRDNDAWLAGVNLRWELFDGLRRFDERARARALENAARQNLEQYGREVAFQVRESLLRRDEAEKRLAVARSSLGDAEEGVRLIGKRFANSLATMVEVLDAQTSLNRARAAVAENETEFALATGRVWYSAGIFLQEVMK